MDTQHLQKELDRVKVAVFLGKNSAFFGSLACTLDFHWDSSIKTAETNGKYLKWNPEWFLKLTKDERIFIYLHELWHVARLHPIRGGSRNQKLWRIACDYKINNNLVSMGYDYGSLSPYVDPKLDNLSEEEIYDLLEKGSISTPQNGWVVGADDGESDLTQPTDEDKHQIISKVVQAKQQADVAGENAGSITGGIEELLDTFLSPVIPWQTLLHQFFIELINDHYSWSTPNRRHQDMYLPGITKDNSRLEHLCYYMDVSGSITTEDAIRFNSEIKYIKDTFNPEKLTLVQFDTEITNETVIEEFDEFNALNIIGRGGTSLVPVKKHIEKHKPTAAIIFSDLECQPMNKLSEDIPVIWVVINNKHAKVNFGTKVHINV